MSPENSQEPKKCWQRYPLLLCLLGLVCIGSSTGPVLIAEGGGAQEDVKVGETTDDCDAPQKVRFHGKDGDIIVRPGESKRVEMPASMSEFQWFCADSRERVANDEFFNVVRISRQSNGDITWKFYRAAAQPEPGSSGGGNNKPDLVRVGDTKDGCDGERDVRFKTRDNNDFKVKANQSKLVALSGPMTTIPWRCVRPNGTCPPGDDCSESSSNPVTFNWVQLDRAGNGALSWVFYRERNTPASAPPGTNAPKYRHNATGNLRVMVSLPNTHKEVPFPAAFLKTKLDEVWNTQRDTITDQMKTLITDRGKEAAKKLDARFHLDSLTVSTTSSNELRTAAQGSKLWLKYAAHNNTIKARFIKGPLEPKFTITFDIQLEMSLSQASLAQPPQADKAVLRLAHTEVEGSNFFGDVVQEIFKSKLQNVQTTANNFSQDFTKEINAWLKDNWPKAPNVPANLVKSEISVSQAGTVRFCLRTPGAPDCQFGPLEAPPTPGVLDADGDGCGQRLIWIRDAERQNFISIAKGKSALIEVESRRFEWYCGGNQGPEAQEWAKGPVGTYLVRVSRNATGDGLKWKFLSWH